MARLTRLKSPKSVKRRTRFLPDDASPLRRLRLRLVKAKHPRPYVCALQLRDYGEPGRIATLIDAPYAGRTAMVADYHKGQSPVETLLANAIDHVARSEERRVGKECRP